MENYLESSVGVTWAKEKLQRYNKDYLVDKLTTSGGPRHTRSQDTTRLQTKTCPKGKQDIRPFQSMYPGSGPCIHPDRLNAAPI